MSADKQTPDAFLRSLQSEHQREQDEAGLRNFARMVRYYHEQLRASGFNALEALALTTNFQQTALIANANNQDRK